MPRRPATFTQADVARVIRAAKQEGAAEVVASVVYFVRIGKHVKIGFTTNLDQRLKSFATSTPGPIDVLASFAGGRQEEARLHSSLAELRMRGEFFHFDHRISGFIDRIEAGSIDDAWQWLDDTHPMARQRRKVEERSQREAVRRASRTELNAHFATLVAERKRTLGW